MLIKQTHAHQEQKQDQFSLLTMDKDQEQKSRPTYRKFYFFTMKSQHSESSQLPTYCFIITKSLDDLVHNSTNTYFWRSLGKQNAKWQHWSIQR